MTARPSDLPLVAVVVKSYPPAFRSGGPGRSVSAMLAALADDVDMRVVTSLDDNGHNLTADGVEPMLWQRRSGADVFALPPTMQGSLRMIGELRRLDADVLYLNTLFHPVFGIAPLVGRRLGLVRPRRTVLAPRGEFSEGALGLKGSKKSLFLAAFRVLGLGRGLLWHATSDLEAERIRATVGPTASVHVAPVLRPLDIATAPRPDRRGPLQVVLLSKIDPMKNVVGALEIVAACRADVHLTIAGPVKSDAYWAECLRTIDRLGLTDRVTVQGPVPPDAVAAFLTGFDAFLLPTLGENFGHVILEALAAGLPTVISDTTRWNRIEAEGAGWALPLADLGAFADRLDRLAVLDHDERVAMSRAALDVARRYVDDPIALDANRHLFVRPSPRIAVVTYAFPVTTQTFHHRRHRVFAESGVLEGIHFVKPADGAIEARSQVIVDRARRIGRASAVCALPHLVRPTIARSLVAGLRAARPGNLEGGRSGFAWQALHGVALGRSLRARREADVVHGVFAAAAATVAWFAAEVAGLPFTFEAHSPASLSTNPGLLAVKLGRADRVFAISDYTANRLRSVVPDAAIDIVHCGLDLDSTSPTAPEATYDVVAVGSLIPVKGHDVLIEASALLSSRWPHRVAIIGDGPERPGLESRIRNAGAAVDLLGSLAPDRVAAIRCRSSVGVLASKVMPNGDEDGVPVSLMEFMADGIPVVSTDVAGIPELLDHGRAGALCPPDDPAALAAALERALDDAEWRHAVTTAAADRIRTQFDNRTESLRLVELLRTVAARSPR